MRLQQTNDGFWIRLPPSQIPETTSDAADQNSSADGISSRLKRTVKGRHRMSTIASSQCPGHVPESRTEPRLQS